MSDFIGLECWDSSDPERADRERDAYEDSLLDEQPPEDPDECPACDGKGCLVLCGPAGRGRA